MPEAELLSIQEACIYCVKDLNICDLILAPLVLNKKNGIRYLLRPSMNVALAEATTFPNWPGIDMSASIRHR